ncbi:alpha/beta fold hydrolase [Streptomyces thinghirensis]|nr:alpha/beta fold hydrolase [Streptomyces thinghirensis]
MPVLPGAEPFRHEGGEVGVLLCHGFTGSPQSLRPWAQYLAARGLTVALPLLPGHGTRWQDMQVTGWQDWYAEVDRELRALRERCASVFVAGLSMGGALVPAARRQARGRGLRASWSSTRRTGCTAWPSTPFPSCAICCPRRRASPATSPSRSARSWGTTRCRCTRRTRCVRSSV